MAVVVFGSINMDLVARTPRLPVAGETITGTEFLTIPGGKGANQAVAARRLDVPVQMVGRVGDDNFGPTLIDSLNQAGVDITAVATDDTTSSGIAIIAVDTQGQNNIIIVPGANGHVDHSDVERLKPYLTAATVLMLQLEIPIAANIAAAKLARQVGCTVILDPAPAQSLPAELYPLVDIMTPNEVETQQLVGFEITSIKDAWRAGHTLLDRGVRVAVIKLGSQGVAYVHTTDTNNRAETTLPAYAVQAVDTVAAGDAFNGGMAAALSQGQSLSTAIRWGTSVAALSTTKIGAQPSMPTRTEFDAFQQTYMD